MTRRRPSVTLKLAETADGFVAGGPHDPRLSITGVAANGVVHVMRAMHDAIMVGIGTILADDPLMTVRLPGINAKPLRIVLDAGLKIPPQSRVIETAVEGPILVLAGESGWLANGAAFCNIPDVEIATVALSPDGRVDLAAALGLLSERGITRLFSEGGPTIGTALITAGLVDDVLLFTAPRPLGGDGVPSLRAPALAALSDRGRYRLAATRSIGVDRLKHYESVS